MRVHYCLIALSLAGCTGSVVPCSSRPTDPMCADFDSGVDVGVGDSGPMRDGGVDSSIDAHVPCNGTCSGATSHCLVASETCVACLAEADCSGTTAAPHCDTTNHACVACLDSAQCSTAAMARCDTTAHTCGACTASADCAHLTGMTVCNVSAGSCVQCVSNADCDATHGCNASTHACIAFTAMSANTCDTCVRDAECHTGQLCVPMMYDDPNTAATDPVPVGNHCLWRQDATGTGAPGGSCFTNERPYARASMLTSVDGVATMVCTFRESTCEAQAGFSLTNCMTLDAAGNARCGLDMVPDGVCQPVDATTNRCSVFCLSDDDCPAGSGCTAGASPRVCHF